jgi:pyruvate,water dikinase
MSYVRPFDSLSLEDVPLVGGKNAALGEMIRAMVPRGVRVPDGFATTASAYRSYLDHNQLTDAIRRLLSGFDPGDVGELARRGHAVRELILAGVLPSDLADELVRAYRALSLRYGEEATDVAVRSSATAEDLPEASFAGQQETYLNVRGAATLLEAARRCLASLFTDRAIAYRSQKGFDHLGVALSVGVQKMVRSDLAASGVLFTLDTETGFRDVVLVNAAYGLGENVVRGVVNPDEFYVFKPTLRQGFRPILQKRLGTKELRMVYETRGGTVGTRNLPVPEAERQRFAITDDEVLQLARWSLLLEEHFGARAGTPRPLDIEWAKDGLTGELFVLQARPETVHSTRDRSSLHVYRLPRRSRVLVQGRAVGSRIGRGAVRLVPGAAAMDEFRDGEVLVTEMTDPDWVPVMRKAAAIVTERGGRTCHAAIVSRELDIPAVVGAAGALEALADGAPVTVSCAEGEAGYVYEGLLDVEVETITPGGLPRPVTRVMMNVGDPDQAFELSFVPNDGVGLARIEFIITSAIRVHPMALLRHPHLADAQAATEIERLTRGYADKGEYFVERLAQGIAKIAAAFYPKDVIVRTSDFKTNEYAGLLGGREFEPLEENPMLGFRGASRYYHPAYEPAFALECAAIRRVRFDMGLTNVKVMIPFCRTVEEGRRVVETLARYGLARGENGLEVYVMCEIPANVIRAAELAEVFDGFSIGSNDLTQLVLGVDRDSPSVASLFDERDEAVKAMIRQVVGVARDHGRKIGICGQAPSDYPDFARFLVDCGIDAISLTPDRVVDTIRLVSEHEGRTRSVEQVPPSMVPPPAPESDAPVPSSRS